MRENNFLYTDKIINYRYGIFLACVPIAVCCRAKIGPTWSFCTSLKQNTPIYTYLTLIQANIIHKKLIVINLAFFLLGVQTRPCFGQKVKVYHPLYLIQSRHMSIQRPVVNMYMYITE